MATKFLKTICGGPMKVTLKIAAEAAVKDQVVGN
jgi:hypothetical protein